MRRLDYAETAAGLGVTKRTLQRWVRDGAPHKRERGKVTFNVVELQIWRARVLLDKRLDAMSP